MPDLCSLTDDTALPNSPDEITTETLDYIVIPGTRLRYNPTSDIPDINLDAMITVAEERLSDLPSVPATIYWANPPTVHPAVIQPVQNDDIEQTVQISRPRRNPVPILQLQDLQLQQQILDSIQTARQPRRSGKSRTKVTTPVPESVPTRQHTANIKVRVMNKRTFDVVRCTRKSASNDDTWNPERFQLHPGKYD